MFGNRAAVCLKLCLPLAGCCNSFLEYFYCAFWPLIAAKVQGSDTTMLSIVEKALQSKKNLSSLSINSKPVSSLYQNYSFVANNMIQLNSERMKQHFGVGIALYKIDGLVQFVCNGFLLLYAAKFIKP